MSSGPPHSHNPAGLAASYRRLHKLHSRCVALGIQKKSSIVRERGCALRAGFGTSGLGSFRQNCRRERGRRGVGAVPWLAWGLVGLMEVTLRVRDQADFLWNGWEILCPAVPRCMNLNQRRFPPPDLATPIAPKHLTRHNPTEISTCINPSRTSMPVRSRRRYPAERNTEYLEKLHWPVEIASLSSV
jgi:hypothetical protein